jgi:DNA sulfur modification protein DndD
VGRLIPTLCSQFVGFTISTERLGFITALEENKVPVRYLTMFRKTPGTKQLEARLPTAGVVHTDNAVLVEGREYFHTFDLEEETD